MAAHVDTSAEVVGVSEVARSLQLQVQAPPSMASPVDRTGPVAADGISLTRHAGDGARGRGNSHDHALYSCATTA
jgi:riboflavin synthase alpha subunit